jgi:peptide-methionine (S)-S-oxide reductase
MSTQSLSASYQSAADSEIQPTQTTERRTIVLGGGCFWCVEAVFQRIKGVEKIESGYAGGKVKNPTYKEVCSGLTGHAEVVRITYNPNVVSAENLLYVFFRTHDPTTLNRQGNDVGTQYRSCVFYADDNEKQLIERAIAEANAAKIWPNPIVTTVEPLTIFYVAEDYHQNYYNENRRQPYCVYVIDPKVEKLFKDKDLNQWVKPD